MIRVREVRHQTYEMSDPTPNRQYATNIGILRPKLSLVAPYWTSQLATAFPHHKYDVLLAPVYTPKPVFEGSGTP